MPQNQQSHRKDEHISLAEKYYHAAEPNDFDQVRLRHDALPETDVATIETTATVGKWQWPFPLYIEAMTGGSVQTGALNARLGKIAAVTHLPMATGSQSVAIKDDSLAPTFSCVRDNDPHGLIFGNLGAGHSLTAAKTAIKMLTADALELHLNVVQELVMPEGDRHFKWLANIQAITTALPIPVIVKEVGFGISRPTMTKLYQAGVRYLDLGGHGGTNFADIENRRRPQREMSYLSSFGLSTVESLLAVQDHPADLTILAAGGIRTPLDAIKALILGADAVGMAGVVLHEVLHHTDAEVIQWLQDWQAQFKLLMALIGATTIDDLHQMADKLILSPELLAYQTTIVP
jgi:isopentenyl-diphosphate delta-isomerase